MEAWALPWVEAAGVGEFEAAALLLLGTALNRYPSAEDCTVRQADEVQRWAVVADRVSQGLEEGGPLTLIPAGLLRKAGRVDEAARMAEEALANAPSWHGAVALGLAQRARGDVEAAVGAFTRALELDSSDMSARLEAGDTYFGAGQWKRAAEWYGRTLSIEPEHRWALPSKLFCDWKDRGDEASFDQLTTFFRAGNRRAFDLWLEVVGLEEPTDATANVLRRVRRQILEANPERRGSPTMKITVSCLEATDNR